MPTDRKRCFVVQPQRRMELNSHYGNRIRKCILWSVVFTAHTIGHKSHAWFLCPAAHRPRPHKKCAGQYCGEKCSALLMGINGVRTMARDKENSVDCQCDSCGKQCQRKKINFRKVFASRRPIRSGEVGAGDCRKKCHHHHIKMGKSVSVCVCVGGLGQSRILPTRYCAFCACGGSCDKSIRAMDDCEWG